MDEVYFKKNLNIFFFEYSQYINRKLVLLIDSYETKLMNYQTIGGNTFFKYYLFCLSLLLLSCDKRKEEHPKLSDNFYGIDSVMIQFAAYKPGTYFTYIDSVTLEYDSIFVVKLDHDTVFLDEGNFKGNHEIVTCYLKDNQGYNIYLTIPIFQNFDNRSYILYERSDQTQGNSFFSFVSPIQIGQKITTPDYEETSIVDFIDSIDIDNHYYYDIIKLRLTNDLILSADTSFLYYAKGIGLIKWHSSDFTRNMRLSNYKVNY